jgi:hypothetical protein
MTRLICDFVTFMYTPPLWICPIYDTSLHANLMGEINDIGQIYRGGMYCATFGLIKTFEFQGCYYYVHWLYVIILNLNIDSCTL